jgi:RNA polymerase sigma-70 factor (ECF subfamily)
MDELLRRYWTGMVRYVTRYTTSTEEAEDMTQEAFLLLWEGKVTWSGVGTFRSFLFGVARNLARNEGRRWRQFVHAPVEDIDAVNDARYPGPDASLAEKNVAEAFAKAIDSLPPRRREIFTLARVHGMSYPEIAAIMHISTQTVANQMSAALSDLRRALGPLVGR